MVNWQIHSLIGIILGILCVIMNSGLNQNTLYAATIATILGALIPDIDHKKSKIRNVFRSLIFIVLLFLLYLTLSNYFKISIDISLLASENIILLFLLFAVLVFISSILTSLVESFIPRHRGPVHRIFAALLYSIIIFGVGVSLGFESVEIIALWGFIGYLSHIFLDILF